MDEYLTRYLKSYMDWRTIESNRLEYFRAVNALNWLYDCNTHVDDFVDPSFIQTVSKVEDYMIDVFREISGVNIPKLIKI